MVRLERRKVTEAVPKTSGWWLNPCKLIYMDQFSQIQNHYYKMCACHLPWWRLLVFGYNTQLHWLPIHSRYIFQVLGSHLKFSEWSSINIHQITFVLYVPSRSRRSCDQGLLAVHCTSLKTKGDRAFSTVAPELWNSFPFSLRSADSVEPNTYLFTIAFNELF